MFLLKLKAIFYSLTIVFHNLLWNIIPNKWSIRSFMWISAKIDFDNLAKLIVGVNTFAGATIVSQEIDFELPRGFIAKIRFIEMRFEMQEDLETVQTEFHFDLSAVLVLDPDDAVMTDIGENETQQDGIAWHKIDVFQQVNAGASGMAVHADPSNKQIPFDANNLDVVTARNMRFNCLAGGAGVANVTESVGLVLIYYTLEEVTDVDILNLLDIL